MENKRNFNQRLHDCLGQVISMRRKYLGLSQEELAEESGVDRAFISSVERGKRNPSFGILARVAHGLRMRYARLVHNCESCAEDDKEKSA